MGKHFKTTSTYFVCPENDLFTAHNEILCRGYSKYNIWMAGQFANQMQADLDFLGCLIVAKLVSRINFAEYKLYSFLKL